MGDDTLVYYGGAIKALDEHGKVGGYAVLWGSPAEKDASGDYFKKDCYLGPNDGDNAEFIFHHSTPIKNAEHLADRRFRPVKTRRDEVGLWAESVLDMADDYERQVFEMAKAGKLGYSTGSAPHRVRKSADGGIYQWPIVECSATPSPCEPRLKGCITALKSLPPIEFKVMGSTDSSQGGALVPNAATAEKHVWRHDNESISDCVSRKLEIIKREEPNISHEAALGKAEGMCRETKMLNFGPDNAGKVVQMAGKSYHIGPDGTATEFVELKGARKTSGPIVPAKKSALDLSHTSGPLGQQTLAAAHAHLSDFHKELSEVHKSMEPGADAIESIKDICDSVADAIDLCEEHHAKHYPAAAPLSAKAMPDTEECKAEPVKGDGSETDYESGHQSDEDAPGGERKADPEAALAEHADEYAKMTPAEKMWVDREIKAIGRLAARKAILARHERRLERAAELRAARN